MNIKTGHGKEVHKGTAWVKWGKPTSYETDCGMWWHDYMPKPWREVDGPATCKKCLKLKEATDG